MSDPIAHLPTRFGDFQIRIFTDAKGIESAAIIKGTPQNGCLVRLHSECATGDIFGSWRCDCRDQLESSLRKIDEAECGVVLYLRGHEGRGIGLGNKIRAYKLQENGLDTLDANLELGFKADQRDYSAAINMLRELGLSSVRLMTNNRAKIKVLEDAGIQVIEHVPLWVATNPWNKDYIRTKKERMGHFEE